MSNKNKRVGGIGGTTEKNFFIFIYNQDEISNRHRKT